MQAAPEVRTLEHERFSWTLNAVFMEKKLQPTQGIHILDASTRHVLESVTTPSKHQCPMQDMW